MPRVVFTEILRRHLPCPPEDVAGETVRQVLDDVFQKNPGLRSYLLDEQGALRHHVAVFVDGRAIEDRVGLGDRVGPQAEVYVMQALSGG